MGDSQLAISPYEKETRVRQYKTDPTIEAFRNIIFKIVSLAKPRILVHEDPKKSKFEVDEQSQMQINYWKQKMEEYILSNYSDIITISEK